MELIILFIALVSGFLLRLSFSTGRFSDEHVAFWLTQRLQRSRWLDYEVNDSVVPGIRAYPALAFFVVSRFPEALWGIAGRVLNALYDVLTALVVYGVSRCLLESMDVSPEIAGLSPATAAVLLFLTAPILLPVTARLTTFKARSMGLTLTTLFFGVMGAATVYRMWPLLLATILLGLLIILSSQFALQVMIFFSLCLSVLLRSAVPAAMTLATLVLGYCLPRVGTREALRFWWHHVIWYQRNWRKETTASRRNRIRDMIALPIYAVTDPRRFVRLWFRELSPIIALYSVPVVFVLMAMWATRWTGWRAVAVSPALEYLWGIVLASVIAFALTSLRPLLFLGEAERYFEYSAPAFSILLPVLMVQLPEAARENWLWGLLLLHLAVVFSSAVYVKRADIARSSIELPDSLAEVIDWCSRNLNDARLAPVPMKLSFVLSYALRETDRSIKYYYRFILRDGERGFRSYEEDTGGLIRQRDEWSESLNVFKIGPADLSDKYGVTHLLVGKRYAEGLRRTWGPTDAAILDTPVFENEGYTLCVIPQTQETVGGSQDSSH